MPRKYIASWEGAPRFRWSKMIGSKRHRISCRQLKLPKADWTKERSWEAAKAYFGKIVPIQPDLEPDAIEAIEKLDRMIAWAKANSPNEVATLEDQRKSIETNHWSEDDWQADPDLEKTIELAKQLGIEVPNDTDPQVLNHFFGKKQTWDDRLRQQKQIATSYTLRFQTDEWLKLVKADCSFKTGKELDRWANRFVNELGETFDIRDLSSEQVTRMYHWTKAQDVENKGKVFRIFKRLVKHLAEEELAPMPANIDSRKFKFSTRTKAVKKFDDQLVIECLNGFPERIRLYALLGLNCSMTNKDIAYLCWKPVYKDEDGHTYSNLAWVDFKKGTITRSRVKTQRQKDPPIVTYKLWPTTMKLLKKLKSNHDTYVLTSKSNTILVHKSMDLIYKQWSRLKEEKRKLHLKDFRTIGATAVGSVKEYLPYREVYLANRPTDITTKHYDATSQEIMDEITDYIGQRFGQLKKPRKTRKAK